MFTPYQMCHAHHRTRSRRDNLPSLTLAGASEEIFGVLSRLAGKPAAIDFMVNYYFGDTDPTLPDKERKEVIRRVLNRSRNEAKPANNADETHYDVERAHPL